MMMKFMLLALCAVALAKAAPTVDDTVPEAEFTEQTDQYGIYLRRRRKAAAPAPAPATPAVAPMKLCKDLFVGQAGNPTSCKCKEDVVYDKAQGKNVIGDPAGDCRAGGKCGAFGHAFVDDCAPYAPTPAPTPAPLECEMYINGGDTDGGKRFGTKYTAGTSEKTKSYSGKTFHSISIYGCRVVIHDDDHGQFGASVQDVTMSCCKGQTWTKSQCSLAASSLAFGKHYDLNNDVEQFKYKAC